MKPNFILFKRTIKLFAGLVFIILAAFSVKIAQAATLSLSPSTGTFTVGSTFEVSIYLDTQGQDINAIEASLSFPADKLQLVSPTAGKSIITVWTVQPNVNNQSGRLDLQGGIPGGFNSSHGLITTMTFRVKAVGPAVIRFQGNSKVLLNDGYGTNGLNNTTNGVYTFSLPPPAGPDVASQTHPDQDVWYKSANLLLNWAPEEGVEGYSYSLNDRPVDTPDDIVDKTGTQVVYQNLPDGVEYFHIKSFRPGSGWGGVTNFAIHIDTTPPAAFPLDILPDKRIVRKEPVVNFRTTDNGSGMDHYEFKIVKLDVKENSGNEALFVEAVSPYLPGSLEVGSYQVIVRAYDHAGNFRDSSEKLVVLDSIGGFITPDGIKMFSLHLSWVWTWIILGSFIVLLLFLGYLVRKWHKKVNEKKENGHVPEDLESKLKELQEYRRKYGTLLGIFIAALLLVGTFGGIAKAADELLAPPVMTTISSNITSQETFYVLGTADVPGMEVTVYLQNRQTGATYSDMAEVGKNNQWSLHFKQPLPSGRYSAWVQGRVAGQDTPPSSEQEVFVTSTAVQFGHFIISYDRLNAGLLSAGLAVVLILLGYIVVHWTRGRRKHKLLMEEIRRTEESIHRGFAIIKRDIQLQLESIKQARVHGKITDSQQRYEQQLMADVSALEAHLGKEVWEIEHTEQPV